jgi:hypothetical protein
MVLAGKEILTTEEDGSESATETVYEIVSFDMQNGEGRGIILAYIHTDCYFIVVRVRIITPHSVSTL